MAREAIEQKQREALGRSAPFTLAEERRSFRERLLLEMGLPYAGLDSLDHRGPLQWQDAAREPAAEHPWDGRGPLTLSLKDALQLGAKESRQYQEAKESLFREALDYLGEKDAFETSYAGTLSTLFSLDRSGDPSTSGLETGASASVSRRLKAGALLSTRLGIDLVRLLTPGSDSNLGVFADASINLPLLRGAGRDIHTEPLTQAERDLLYAVWNFERFRGDFTVDLARDYLGVLESLSRLEIAEASYRALVQAGRRAGRLFTAGRIEGIQVDQAYQDELRARNAWISAGQDYQRRLDAFKNLLGLPTDAEVLPERRVLADLFVPGRELLVDEEPPRAPGEAPLKASDPVSLRAPVLRRGGALETDPEKAVAVALDRRLDLRVQQGRIYDSRRRMLVAADALDADLAFRAAARAGDRRSLATGALEDAVLRPERGQYSAGLELDFPFERTAEALAYRESFVDFQAAVRDFQRLEDEVKAQVREGLRNLLEFGESIRIQAKAVELARRRVESTELFLQAGRAQMRDLLEAQEDLITARNAHSAAQVAYLVAELVLQRDMGTLEVGEDGNWKTTLKDDGFDDDR